MIASKYFGDRKDIRSRHPSSLTLNSCKSLPSKRIFCEIRLPLRRPWLSIKAEPSVVIYSPCLTVSVISWFCIEDRTSAFNSYEALLETLLVKNISLDCMEQSWSFWFGSLNSQCFTSRHISVFVANPKYCGHGLYQAGSTISCSEGLLHTASSPPTFRIFILWRKFPKFLSRANLFNLSFATATVLISSVNMSLISSYLVCFTSRRSAILACVFSPKTQ